MLRILSERLRQRHRTALYPQAPPTLPERFVGLPVIEPERCSQGCDACRQACPTDAISGAGPSLALDLGRCLFCTACTSACPDGGIRFSQDHQLAARTRADLRVGAQVQQRSIALDEKLRRMFGRSLRLRQVSAGGCNACEADVNVLGTVVFDLGRFGIQMVASPRHADGLLITGPVTQNMQLALKKTYDAVPSPKIVIAVGACAISGGPYLGHPEAHDGADSVVPVDLYIPGCPPHPFTILDGLLRMLGRLEQSGAGRPRSASTGDDQRQKLDWTTRRAEEGVRLFGCDVGAGPAPEPGADDPSR